MTRVPAVLTRGLSKSYGDVRALRDVDVEVGPGETFGFLGPNGSGRTTAIRCPLDLIRPGGGTVRVLGLDPQAGPVAVRSRAGHLPGELRLDDNLTADGVLRFFDRLRRGRADPGYIKRLGDRLGLDLTTPVKNISGAPIRVGE
jgi:ABC-2 type transport system ATP-binding protein